MEPNNLYEEIQTQTPNSKLRRSNKKTRQKILNSGEEDSQSEFDSAHTSPEPINPKDKRPPINKPVIPYDLKLNLLKNLDNPFPNYSEFCTSTNQSLSETSNSILFKTLESLENEKTRFSKNSIENVLHNVLAMQKLVMIAEKEIKVLRDQRDLIKNKQTYSLGTDTNDLRSDSTDHCTSDGEPYLMYSSNLNYRRKPRNITRSSSDLNDENHNPTPELTSNQTKKKTYADFAAQHKIPQEKHKSLNQPNRQVNIPTFPVRNDEATIIISDSDKDLTTNIQTKFTPSSLGIGVKRIQRSRLGKTIIEVDKVNDLNKLKEEILKHYPTANISSPKKRLPLIDILNIKKHLTKDQIQDYFFMQNPSLTKHLQAKALYIRNYEDGIACTFEVDPQLFKEIQSLGKLYIGWKYCSIQENFFTPRCYKCQEFGHLQKKCLNAIRCTNCGGSHDEQTCRKATRCYNCNQNNRYSPSKFNHEHRANDPNCPCINKRIAFLKSITSYA